MKLNRRSFWGLFAGFFTAIPFLQRGLPTYNKNEWVYHPLRREHQDMVLRQRMSEPHVFSSDHIRWSLGEYHADRLAIIKSAGIKHDGIYCIRTRVGGSS